MVLLAGDLQVTFHAQGEESFRTANCDSEGRFYTLYSGGSWGGKRDGDDEETGSI
jgi:hypothetical protein